jgi:hypothetical protein
LIGRSPVGTAPAGKIADYTSFAQINTVNWPNLWEGARQRNYWRRRVFCGPRNLAADRLAAHDPRWLNYALSGKDKPDRRYAVTER